MRRLLLCLPVCLLTAPDAVPPTRPPDRGSLQDVQDRGDPLPDEATMVRLAKTDPVKFLEWCLIRYDREVQGYRVNLRKKERIAGTSKPAEDVEDIQVDFREKPFAVLFTYDAEPRPARRVLYLKPEEEKDKGKLVVQLPGFLGLVPVEMSPDGTEARESSRYPMYEFGMKVGTQRTLAAWVAAKKQNALPLLPHSVTGPNGAAWVAAKKKDALHIEFLGEEKVANLDGRPCWVLKRTPYLAPEEDGVAELTIYIDKESWLQTGSVLKDRKGDLIGEYWFRGVMLNPTFEEDTFTRKSLKKK